ncbi:MAG: PorT family protein [Flavobacterium sp.]|nr:MAG: PorT family protein [Flavobacterium sp.]
MINNSLKSKYLAQYLIICIFLCSISSFSQKEFTFNIRAGINLSNYVNNTFGADFKSGVGFAVGIEGEYLLNEKWSLISGLSYERKTIVSDFDVQIILPGGGGQQIVNVNDKFHYNYLSLPLMARYTLKDGKVFIFFNLGGYAGYLLNAKFNDEDQTSLYVKGDGGLAGGIGVLIPVSEKNNFIIELRDHYSLIDINESTTETQINTFSLLLGISLN